jgi:hypothetical protein
MKEKMTIFKYSDRKGEGGEEEGYPENGDQDEGK